MPGMIDTHVHVANAADLGRIRGLGLQMVAAAGATTIIDLGGSMDALTAGIVARGSGVNVGSVGYLKPGETVPEGRLSSDAILEIVGTALEAGSLGIKLWGGYYPFTPEETASFISTANHLNAYVAYHVGTTKSGSRLDGLREVPSLLGSMGRVHIAHINAYCRGSILRVEDEIHEALDILHRTDRELGVGSPSRPPPYRCRQFKGPRAAVTTTPLEEKLPPRNAVAQT